MRGLQEAKKHAEKPEDCSREPLLHLNNALVSIGLHIATLTEGGSGTCAPITDFNLPGHLGSLRASSTRGPNQANLHLL